MKRNKNVEVIISKEGPGGEEGRAEEGGRPLRRGGQGAPVM